MLIMKKAIVEQIDGAHKKLVILTCLTKKEPNRFNQDTGTSVYQVSQKGGTLICQSSNLNGYLADIDK